MQSEVAINPSKLYLTRSNGKDLSQQEAMVGKYSEKLGKTIKGVKAVIGEAPDYVELAFAHLDATRGNGQPDYLFGEKYGSNYARTKTKTGGSSVACVGTFHPASGLNVFRWNAGDGYDVVHVAPLVVPA